MSSRPPFRHTSPCPPLSRARRFASWSCPLLLAALLVACGSDGPAKERDADAGEVDAPDTTTTFTVAIDASALTGNVPQRVAFSAKAEGVALEDLALEWAIDGQPFSSEPGFEIVFNRAGQTKVDLFASLLTDPASRAVASVTVRLNGCGQLRFDRFSLDAPTEVAPGGVTRVRVGRLINDGDTIATPFHVALFLSEDDVFDAADDREIGRIAVPGMGEGLTTTSALDLAGQTFTVPADLAPGTWYAFLVADPDGVVNECQELDNALAAGNVLEVDPEADKQADLRIDNLAVPDGTVVSQGRPLTWTFAITNAGEADARQFRYGFWLSTDRVLDDGDRAIAPVEDDLNRIQLMPAGLSLGFFKTWLVPDDLPDGTYWILGKIDALDAVAESDELNNDAVSANTFEMRYEAPECFDFALSRLTVTPTTTYWGGTVAVTLTIDNPGGEDAPEGNLARVYMSLAPTLSPANALILGNFPLPAVPAGETRVVDLLVPIGSDLPVLPHYLGVVLDPSGALPECSEGNNAALFADPVRVNALAEVDVAVGAVAYHPRSVAAGEAIKIDYTVESRGTSAATTFQVGVVLSRDPEISVAGVASGADVVLDRVTIPLLPPGEAKSFIRDVVIPSGLDHTVAAWHVGVLADLDGFLSADINPQNNARLAADTLTVSGALGGCFEDLLEPNDNLASARVVTAGTTRALGACGNADWFLVDVPAGRSLFVTATSRAIVSVPPTPAELVVELFAPEAVNTIYARSVAGPVHRLYAFGVGDPGGPPAGTWAIKVTGLTSRDRAAYDLDVALLTAPTGIDLIPFEALAAPSAAYAGGRLVTRFREVNFGAAPAPARTSRVFLSRNRELEPNLDVALGEVALPVTAPMAIAEGELNVLLSAALSPGTWYALVVGDANGAVAESDEANNVAVSNAIFLDPLKVCADDAFEPNDERVIATPVVGASYTQRGLVVCPTLDDWYGFDLAAGDSLDVDIAYNHEPNKGRLVLELYTPRGAGAVVSDARNGVARVVLPWAWEAGRWYVRVANDPAAASPGPYTYELRASRARGAATLTCSGERYEPNDSAATPARIGCGHTTGNLCNADLDWYRLPGRAGQRLTVATTHTGNQHLLQLFLPGGSNAIASIFGTGSMAYTPAIDGPVLLRVSPRFGVNSMTTFPYGFTVSGLDAAEVAVSALVADLQTLDRGEDVRVTFTLENPCSLATAPFDVTVWLSLDGRVDGGDLPLYSLADPGLVAGASRTYSPKVTVPASTAPGAYQLLVEADASQLLPEENELDNVAAVPLIVTDPCRADAFEPNDSAAAARPIGAGVVGDLTICPYDQDWFAIVSPAGASWEVAIDFAHADGDLDLRVYDPLVSAALPVATSATSDDGERVVVSTPLATTLRVRVNGYGGARAGYTLAVTPR